MSDLSNYVPAPGLYLFYNYGAGSTLVFEFMQDGRLKVSGPAPNDGVNQVYMLHDASKEFLTELLTIPFEDFEPNEERHEDCLVV